MPKVEDIARGVLSSLASDAGMLLASRWVSDRYAQLCSRARFRHLREVGEIVVPGAISAGTIITVRGSHTVTGDSTARAAWSPAIRGRFFRTLNVWYEIVEFSGTTLKLKSPFAEDSVTSGGYNIVAKYVALDPRVRWMGEFRHSRRGVRIDRRSLYELDNSSPMRDHIGDGPSIVCEIGAASDTYVDATSLSDTSHAKPRIVELYPYSRNDELVHYVFWSTPPKVGPQDFISDNIDEYVLREGTLVDLMRYKMAKAMDAGQVEQAAHWRNEYRSQKTSWEREILEAIKADKGSDDQTFILRRIGSTRPGYAITTARDQVYSQWPT